MCNFTACQAQFLFIWKKENIYHKKVIKKSDQNSKKESKWWHNFVFFFWVNQPFKHKIWTAWTCYFFYSIFATVYSRIWISEDKFGLSNCAESILAIVITPAKVCYALCKINTKINHPQSTLCVQVHLVRGGGGREEKWVNI